jgi:hypothetical protein
MQPEGSCFNILMEERGSPSLRKLLSKSYLGS